MATKVYDSPTTNIFALLAEEHAEPQARKAKANTNKGPEEVLTPKERAEAKAVQDAARKAQRDADKAKQEAESARRKALELVDDTGFAPQRHQRIKETRTQERNAPAPSETPKGKKTWDEGSDSKGKGGKNWNKNADGSKGTAGPKTEGTKGGEGKTVLKGDKLAGKQEGKGNPKGDGKSNFKGEGKGNYKGEKSNYSKAPKREGFDKHSQGVTSRQPQAKKQGHGRANWDETVPTGLNAAPVSEALANEALAAPGTEAAEAWVDATTPLTAEGEATEPTTVDDKKKEEEDEEENNKTLEEYFAEQAEKKKALEAVVSSLQARQLTDEEKKALTKFTRVENTKVPAKKDTKTTKPSAPTAAPAVAGARKGEKPVSEDLLSFRVAGARSGGRGGARGPRSYEGQRDNSAGRGQGQKKGGRGPQKIGKGKNEFPDLGPK